MGHGTHHRDRSRTGASTAGHGRRLCGSRQPRTVHRRFRRQSRLGWGEAAGITPYVPKPRRSPARRRGRFPKERFRYDAGTDTYACPNGQQLKPLYISRVRDTRLMHYANRGACRGCALKVQCTSNSYRRIGRYADEAVLDRMAERLADRPGVLHRRRESAEHPFGSIKHWMGYGGFPMRRLENVRGEFSLTALAYNIRRATTLVGIPELIAAWGVQTSWNRPQRACCNAAGRMASANRRQPAHGPNPRPLTPQNSTRSYFSHSLAPLCKRALVDSHRCSSHLYLINSESPGSSPEQSKGAKRANGDPLTARTGPYNLALRERGVWPAFAAAEPPSIRSFGFLVSRIFVSTGLVAPTTCKSSICLTTCNSEGLSTNF